MQGNSTVVLVNGILEDDIKESFENPLRNIAKIIYVMDVPTEEDFKYWSEVVDILVIGKFNSFFKFEYIKMLRKLKLVQLFSAGADYLPFKEIPEDVIVACNAGGFSHSIAEYVLTMICAYYKNVIINHNELSHGDFSHQRKSRSIMNLRVGIIGFGGIGKTTACLLSKSITASIFAINRNGQKEEDNDCYSYIGSIKQIDFVLSQVDVVVLSLPLNAKTSGIIDAKKLSFMKEDALIINVARGGLINQRDLFIHLNNHPNFGAVIDAWWIEPFFGGNFELEFPFMQLKNIIGSPHNSYNSTSYFGFARKRVAENIKNFINGAAVTGILDRSEYL